MNARSRKERALLWRRFGHTRRRLGASDGKIRRLRRYIGVHGELPHWYDWRSTEVPDIGAWFAGDWKLPRPVGRRSTTRRG